MSMSDPIVDEVRKYRMEHARRLNFDLAAICEDLRAIQRASGHRVVRLPARKPVETKRKGTATS